MSHDISYLWTQANYGRSLYCKYKFTKTLHKIAPIHYIRHKKFSVRVQHIIGQYLQELTINQMQKDVKSSKVIGM